MIAHSTLLFWVQRSALCEMLLIVLVIFLFLILKMGLKLRLSWVRKQEKTIDQLLRQACHTPEKVTAAQLAFLRRRYKLLLKCLGQIERSVLSDALIQLLFVNILQPRAQTLIKSKHWLKQYFAVNCYHYGVTQADEVWLERLVRSPYLLVALNAAKLIYRTPTDKTMNALINACCQGRSLQRALMIEVLRQEKTQDATMLAKCLFKRLSREKAPYARLFCYQLYHPLTDDPLPVEVIEKDVRSQNIDLALGALRYLATLTASRKQHEILITSLQHQAWEVRAATAKLLGDRADLHALSWLEKALHDESWWVRMNAARALSCLGEKGLAILKHQRPAHEKNAYDAAQQALTLCHQPKRS